MNKCKFCGTVGIIKEIGGLFYAQCPGCDKHIKQDNDQYQYMGNTKSNCEYVWNLNNPEPTAEGKRKYRSSGFCKSCHRNIM